MQTSPECKPCQGPRRPQREDTTGWGAGSTSGLTARSESAGAAGRARLRGQSPHAHPQHFLPEPGGLHAADQAEQQVHEGRGADVLQDQADELVFLLQEHDHLKSNTLVSNGVRSQHQEMPPKKVQEEG